MPKDKDISIPAQLPEIVFHEPIDDTGRWFEVRVPISWKDFTGLDKVKTMSTAIRNIVDAVRQEIDSRLDEQIEEPKIEVKTKEKAKPKDRPNAEALKVRTAAIKKIIKEEPELVLAKRKEFGMDVLDDKGAAAVIHQDDSPHRRTQRICLSVLPRKKLMQRPPLSISLRTFPRVILGRESDSIEVSLVGPLISMVNMRR